jgi:sulfur relay (sulfurtransferase) DsrF/TusC family protein
VWISHALKGAGADLGLLLSGAAVNYAVAQQDAAGLSFGGLEQTQPPRIPQDVTKLIGKGVAVYVVDDDLEERGIAPDGLIPGIERIQRAGLARLFGGYDQVWRW